MNKDSNIGRVMTLDEAITFYERCIEAEKVMGSPLTKEERLSLLNNLQLGKPITYEDYKDMLAERKRSVLVVRSNEKE